MKNEKVENLAANLHEKNRICYAHNKFKTSIKSFGLILKKVYRVKIFG